MRHVLKTVVVFTASNPVYCPVGRGVCVASCLFRYAPSHVTVAHLSSFCCTVKSDSNRVAAASPSKSENVPHTAVARYFGY